VVRRDEEGSEPRRGEGLSSCCASPAGESPVPVSVGAPGSRPQVSEGDLRARAGRQEPVRRHKPRSGEQARGPQHQVKLAASTEKQSGSRAAHVTAKVTPAALVPKRVVGPGGVRSAARVQGEVRNSGDPSASPSSGQGASYKPEAKSAAAQRESEGPKVSSRRRTRREGRGPALVTLEARVSAREWPPRADLTTPTHVRAPFKCDNLNASYGQEPSGGARPGKARPHARDVTLACACDAAMLVTPCTLRQEDHRQAVCGKFARTV
jgi:hypothetical protein